MELKIEYSSKSGFTLHMTPDSLAEELMLGMILMGQDNIDELRPALKLNAKLMARGHVSHGKIISVDISPVAPGE